MPDDREVPIWDFVVKDMLSRDRTGYDRYGTRLTQSTEIDSLQYLYEELLDAAVYTKRLILERLEKLNEERSSD